MTPEIAREVLALHLPAQCQTRIDVLADKCNDGQLSDDERREYETFVRIIDLLAILQAKARAFLMGLPDG